MIFKINIILHKENPKMYVSFIVWFILKMLISNFHINITNKHILTIKIDNRNVHKMSKVKKIVLLRVRSFFY